MNINPIFSFIESAPDSLLLAAAFAFICLVGALSLFLTVLWNRRTALPRFVRRMVLFLLLAVIISGCVMSSQESSPPPPASDSTCVQSKTMAFQACDAK